MFYIYIKRKKNPCLTSGVPDSKNPKNPSGSSTSTILYREYYNLEQQVRLYSTSKSEPREIYDLPLCENDVPVLEYPGSPRPGQWGCNCNYNYTYLQDGTCTILLYSSATQHPTARPKKTSKETPPPPKSMEAPSKRKKEKKKKKSQNEFPGPVLEGKWKVSGVGAGWDGWQMRWDGVGMRGLRSEANER